MVGDGAGLKGRVEGGVIQGTEHAGWGGTLRWAGGGRGGPGGAGGAEHYWARVQLPFLTA